MLKDGTPFVAFSLDGLALKVTSLAGGRRRGRDGVKEGPMLDLADLNERGTEAAARDIGNYVLGFLTIENPDIMNQFANLAVLPSPGPRFKELKKGDDDPTQ